MSVWQDTPVISYAEALQRLLTSASAHPRPAPGPDLLIPLANASYGVAARDLTAQLAVPGFANAAMDGYALRAADTHHATLDVPARMPVAGIIAAGNPPPAIGDHSAWEILTGAPLPTGLDAVVPLERVTRLDARAGNATTVLITEPLRAGQNVRQRGEDFEHGQTVVTAGTRLLPHHLMGLAACGVDEVPVVPPPRVALLVTGSELANHGTALAPGRIRDANGPYLQMLLPMLGTHLTASATASDDVGELRDRLRLLAANADVVLTTGGVSAGRLDLLPGVVRELGGEILFHKVAIRPGKPLLHARLPGGALLFGLPGNPLAVAVGMRFFVMPALRALQGLPAESATPAVTPVVVRGRGALRFFAKAQVSVDGSGVRQVRLLPGQESFRIAPLIAANCWAVVPEGVNEIAAGQTLDTLPLYPGDAAL